MAKTGLMQAILMLALLCSCQTAPVMRERDYESVNFGMTAKSLSERYGEPYNIEKLPDGSVQYHYIERIASGPSTLEENHYLFVIKEGAIIAKDRRRNGSSINLRFSI